MKRSNNSCNLYNEPQSMDLKVLVRHYIKICRPRLSSELKYFEKIQPFSEVLEKASMAINKNGKRFDHQRRLTSASLEGSKVCLSKVINPLKACKNFAELHDLLEKLLHDVHGIGELYCYDTALRLGAFLGIYPELVYLHRGTRDGAKALGLDWRSKTLDLKIFPQPLQKLKPHEIEDFLCIYKKYLFQKD